MHGPSSIGCIALQRTAQQTCRIGRVIRHWPFVQQRSRVAVQDYRHALPAQTRDEGGELAQRCSDRNKGEDGGEGQIRARLRHVVGREKFRAEPHVPLVTAPHPDQSQK